MRTTCFRMTEIEPRAAWDRAHGESEAEHAWLLRFCELGSQRTPTKVARRCGVPVKLVKDAASKWGWTRRAAEYDQAVRDVGRIAMKDEQEALQIQYEVGKELLRIGASAASLKNPALMNMNMVLKMLTEGAELVRRGAGVADIKVDMNTQRSVEELFQNLLGKGDDE